MPTNVPVDGGEGGDKTADPEEEVLMNEDDESSDNIIDVMQFSDDDFEKVCKVFLLDKR